MIYQLRMMSMNKSKSKCEFSKKILYVVWISTTIVVMLAFVLMWHTGDLSPLSYIIPGLFTEVAAATSFYYWKAKNENIKRIERSNEHENKLETEIDKS